MKTRKPSPNLYIGAGIVLALLSPNFSGAQSLLDISGSSLLAPSLAPVGGYAENPQEYLVVSWSVVEDASDIYTYSYSIKNPAGDVLLNSSGVPTSTLEIFDSFSVDFNLATPGAYRPGTIGGAAFQEVNDIDLAWFFSPSVPAGSTGPTVSFESDLPPSFGNANASDAVPPSPWSSIGPGGQLVPVPAAVPLPEPPGVALLGIAGLLLLNFRRSLRV
jgi:hypothetical protein